MKLERRIFGEGVESGLDRPDSTGYSPLQGSGRRHGEGLVDVGDDVFGVLQTDR